MAWSSKQQAEAEAIRSRVVSVHYTRDGEDWLAQARHGRLHAEGMGRTLIAARAAVLSVLVRKINDKWLADHPQLDRAWQTVVSPGGLLGEDVVELPPNASEAVAQALATRDTASAAVAAAQDALSAAVVALDDVGLSLRDSGHVLELSHARIAQVLEQARAETEGDR